MADQIHYPESKLRSQIVEALAPFSGQTLTPAVAQAMVEALVEMASPRPIWIGADFAREDIDALKAEMNASKGPGNFRDLFIGEFHAPTPEEILDEQWLTIMRQINGPPAALVVMRQADYDWLEREWARSDSRARIWPPFVRIQYRGLPIQIDEDYDRPKVFTEAEARRQGRRW